MKLLLSLCGRTALAPESLLLVDPRSGDIEPVVLPDPAFGAFGLCTTPDAVYVVLDHGRPSVDEPERSELCALDPLRLQVRWRYPFTTGRDVHSIAFLDGTILAVSTGTDEIVRLTQDRDGRVAAEDVAWRADAMPVRADRHHLNSIAVIEDEVLVAGFGERPDPGAWQAARDGFVRSLGDGQRALGPVYHPHSICAIDAGELAVCESPLRRVRTSLGRNSQPLPGYARGLCTAGGKLYVGTSRNRHPSEPLSILPYDRSPETAAEGIAAVCELDPATLEIERVMELDPHGREVYEIVELSGSG